MTTKTPANFLPTPQDLVRMIAESTKRLDIRGADHGIATPEELARQLWPGVDLRKVVDTIGCTPPEWVENVLAYEARYGRVGSVVKDGDVYYAPKGDV